MYLNENQQIEEIYKERLTVTLDVFKFDRVCHKVFKEYRLTVTLDVFK